jgi:hypothetical protein
MAGDDVQALLVELATRPDDLELRARAADALDASGKRDEAVRVLAPFINLAGHDDDGQLPCLCKGCLPGAGPAAESGGMQFVRSFAIAGARVLHFWMLADQERERRQVRASVADAMRARLAAVKQARR